MKLFEAEEVGHRFGNIRALKKLSFDIFEGERVGIVGPNGAGKSTLLKILGGLLMLREGELRFRGVPMAVWDRREFSRVVAFLPQQAPLAFPFTCREVVMMGRLPYQRGRFFDTRQDQLIVDRCLRMTDSAALADRKFNQLSGGERQLVLLAAALAQQPRVLLLDEPAAHLDLRHQLQVCKVLRELHDSGSLTLLIVTHDLNFAASFCQRLLLMNSGRLVSVLERSSKEFVLEPKLIQKVFGVRAQDRETGPQRRIVLSYGR